jgi:uncharacterized membrane-anchored protein YhcB (DUF1043 family)
MYKSNSGFRLSRNRFCFLIKYIANQNISAFKSATALILTVSNKLKKHTDLMKKYIKAFFKEIVPIIIGILVALYINNWNENKKDEKYINQILSSMKKELKESNQDIKEKIPQQKTLIDTLDFYKNNDKISIFDVMMKVNGIQIPKIRISSWKAISNSKIELLEYNRISDWANIEEQKEIMLSKTQYLMNFLYPNIKDTSIEKKELIMLMMQDIIVSEKDLQEQIEGIIKD